MINKFIKLAKLAIVNYRNDLKSIDFGKTGTRRQPKNRHRPITIFTQQLGQSYRGRYLRHHVKK
jgi:hypothetical protein